MTIGERIRALRYMHEYPQSFLADSVGIKKQTLYKYENGIITNIPIDKLIAIANALGVSPAYLIGCDEESPAEKWIHDFYDRLDGILCSIDGADSEDLGIDIYKLSDIAESEISITLQEAYEISLEIGVSFLFLCGITDDENADQPALVSEDGLNDIGKDDFLLKDHENQNPKKSELSNAELKLLSLYRDLNLEGQEKLLDYADDLVSSGKYIKSDPYELGKTQRA